ncbi:hypothetical protein IW147_001428 [Coemansia sp. RSA 720]|nr:hypothetical protein IW147_001428 [Coemansia sp. RSA 720]
MTSSAPRDAKSAIGYLHKKSRFYGWSKHIFLLNEHGLAQLSTERQPQSAKDQSLIRLSRDCVIGPTAGINLKHVLALKHKQFVGISDIAHVASQNRRELVVTSTTGILVLRAQSAAERDLWLEALQGVIQSSDVANVSAVAVSEVYSSSDSPVIDTESQTHLSAATASVPREEPPFLLELTLASDLAEHSGPCRLELDCVDNEVKPELNAISWLPSITSFANTALADVPIDNLANNAHCTLPSTLTDTGNICLDPYTSPELNTETEAAQHEQLSNSKGNRKPDQSYINMDAESFDADKFFDDKDSVSDASPSTDLPLAAGSKSELPLGGNTLNAQPGNNGTALEMPLSSLNQPLQYMGITSSPIGTDDAAFGDMFSGFLGKLAVASRESLQNHVATKQQGADAHGTVTLETRGPGNTSNVPSLQPRGGVDYKDDITSNVSLSEESVKHTLANALEETAVSLHILPDATIASNVVKPAAVLDSSVSDITALLMNNISLPDFSVLLGAPAEEASSTPTQAVTFDSQDDKPLLQVATEQADNNASDLPPKPSAKVLDPPGQYGLGGQSMEKLKSVVLSKGLNAVHKTHLDEPPGFQMSLLSKYSDSLNSSRALLSGVGRVGRPKTMHDWQANTTKANTERGMGRAAAIVQYEAAGPTNTGVSKMVRGQLTKEIIEKETERKPAVRRVRRTKSEIKVPPLKAIRLKLNGSIVGSRVAANSSQAAASGGLKYIVKDGRIEGVSGKNESRASLAQLKGRASQMPQAGGLAGSGSDAQPGSNGLGEFSEIQKRLKQVEEQKRQQQQARMLDKDASDGVRISDLIENRQDRPLAVQLEERRRVQIAKQQALMNQQLEQQRMQLEVQRLNMEQQQKHEQFKRQSLCPDAMSTNCMSTVSASQPYAANGWHEYGGSDSYTNQWIHSQSPYGGAPSTASAHAHPSYCYQQPSRPTTPLSAYDHNMAWTQQPRAAGRRFSQYTQNTAPSIQSVDAPACVGRSFSTTNPRRQAGAAFVKPSQAAHSEHSAGSTESWQSHVAHSTRTSIHANTDPLKGGSVFIAPPTLNAAAKRSSSFGYTDPRRNAGSRAGSHDMRFQAMHVENAPPVPPIPQHIAGANMQYAYATPAQGPPAYMQAAPHPGYYQQPPAPYRHWPAPPAHVYSAYAQSHPEYYQPVIDMQRVQRKRTEMAAKIPSLLQQLNHAQVSGIMPGGNADKQPYAKGAYQNASVPQVVRESSGAHYLGDGNTLLIDRVHESEKTKRAFLKKVRHNYTGIGGNAAPAPVFMH